MTGKARSNRWNTAILYACVAAGGMIGSVARYLVSLLLPSLFAFRWRRCSST